MGFRSCITAVFVSVVLLIGVPCAAMGQPGDAQDNSVALQVFSEGEGSPMVMLGGGTLGAAAFAPHAKILATQFRVVRLQTLNVETSQQKAPLPPGYSVKLESGAMRRALDKLGISMPIDLVGQSFGALVGLDFALDHPHRVRTLVLFEPPAFWAVPPEELRNTPDMRRMYELVQGFVPEHEPTDEQYLGFLCGLGNCTAKPPAPGDANWDNWVMRRSALRGLSVIPAHQDSLERVRQFDRPVLIMTGANTVPFHRRINEILAQTFPLAERAELAGGHTTPVSAVEEFVTTLQAFLTRHRER
jgi:pimeloyl-ACP methyl ester carboxylesterase